MADNSSEGTASLLENGPDDAGGAPVSDITNQHEHEHVEHQMDTALDKVLNKYWLAVSITVGVVDAIWRLFNEYVTNYDVATIAALCAASLVVFFVTALIEHCCRNKGNAPSKASLGGELSATNLFLALKVAAVVALWFLGSWLGMVVFGTGQWLTTIPIALLGGIACAGVNAMINRILRKELELNIVGAWEYYCLDFEDNVIFFLLAAATSAAWNVFDVLWHDEPLLQAGVTLAVNALIFYTGYYALKAGYTACSGGDAKQRAEKLSVKHKTPQQNTDPQKFSELFCNLFSNSLNPMNAVHEIAEYTPAVIGV